MICQKGSGNKKGKENTKKYNFQGKSTRSRRWFNHDHEWLEENFMARKPDFYEKNYQMNNNGDDTKTYQLFVVPIGNAKTT